MLSDSTLLRRFRVPAYVILFLGAAFPIADWLLTIHPLQMGSVPWRFGAGGLAANLVVGPLVTFVIIYGIALAFGDRKMVLAVALVAALAGLGAFLIAGSFSLDALQMKSQVRPETLRRFYLTSGQAFVKLLAQGVGGAILAVSAFRAYRAMRRAAPRGRPKHTIVTAGSGAGASNKAGGPAVTGPTVVESASTK